MEELKAFTIRLKFKLELSMIPAKNQKLFIN